MKNATEWLAAVIVTKQQEVQRRRGLDSADHEMFSRALTRYQHTEQEIAEFRRRQPEGTSDPRVSDKWKPCTSYTPPTKTKVVDNKPRNEQQSKAVRSLLSGLKNKRVQP